jgi:hypothetical protein
MLRMLLRGMATGELGSDLRITADEILLADGIQVGEGAAAVMGGTAEWRIADREETAEWQIPDLDEAERIVAEYGELSSNEAETNEATPDLFGPGGGLVPGSVEAASMEETPNNKPPAPPWLEDETERELEWPSFAGPRPKGRERRIEQTERVRYLFPSADDVDWSVKDFGEKSKRNRSA